MNKMDAKSRQELILNRLKKASKPIIGAIFAKETNVSRQVIVQDISILKAKGAPIIATNQGYLYIDEQGNENMHRRIIAVQHASHLVQTELNIIVDHGVTVKDVTVEHAVYGQITASIMVSTRAEVEQFIKTIDQTNAPYLSSLTDGIHLHTLEADSIEKIEAACKELDQANILLRE